jgi:hypothetical protein
MSVLGDKPKYRDLSLGKINLILCAVIALLMLMFLVLSLYQRKKQSNCSEAQHGQGHS